MKYLIVAYGLILCSCAGLYGIKSPKRLDEAGLQKAASRFKIDSFLRFDDSLYHSFWAQVADSQVCQNHYQPLQIFYYEGERLARYHINCYAGGFPNLNWDKNNQLSTFPPQHQAPLDTFLSLERHLSFAGIEQPASQYTVFVYWNRFMGRQTKRFVAAFRKNISLCEQPIRVYFINNDSWFVE